MKKLLNSLALTMAVLLATSLSAFGEERNYLTAKEVMNELEKTPLQPDLALPNILLLGDSISLGYTLDVRKLLKGKANVFRPITNCGPSSIWTEKNLSKWIDGRKYDVIHFNVGLHDISYRDSNGEKDKQNGAAQVTSEQYRENLKSIVTELKKSGNTLIWASTTVVPKNEPSRFAGDEIKYNKIAVEVMEKEGITINDLHELTKGFTKGSFIRPGNVHYTTAASALLGKKVARSIVAALPGTALPDATKKPNIILFLVDDMGLMDTSVPMLVDNLGQPRQHALNQWYRTPNMERLAKHGTRFAQFYAQSVCSPTRVSIMTGQNSARHRVTQFISPENRNPGPEGWRWEGLTHEDVTLPGILRKSGYHTIFAGKAHFAPKGHEGEDPANLGFDVNIAGCSYGQPGSYYGEDGYGNLDPKRKFRGIPGLEKYHKTDTFLSEAITLEAKAAIDQSLEQDKPFFLYMSHYAVHSPFQSDPRFAGNYTKPKKAKAAQAYATLVEGMDKSLGDLMDHVTNKGIGENTLILFVGDNGSDAPTPNVYGHHSSAPLRGKKATCYEGGMRVPFIAGWAQNGESNAFPIAKGAIHTSQIGTVMDLYSTILETAGADNPTGHVVDGVSLLTQFTGKENPGRPDYFLCHFPHIHRSSYFTTLRKGNWKLIYRYRTEPFKRKKEKSLPRYELYDLSTDPYENHNLAEEKPEQLHKMMETLVSRLEVENAQYPVNNKGEELRPMMP